MLDIGTKAPAFELPDQDGNPVNLSDFAGKDTYTGRVQREKGDPVFLSEGQYARMY